MPDDGFDATASVDTVIVAGIHRGPSLTDGTCCSSTTATCSPRPGWARAWALEHLADPLTLAVPAGRANMSVRTFTRRFRAETGVSPTRWLLQQRVDQARILLETGDLSVDRIARRAGFGTATSLRQHLRAAIGVAPTAYRRTFTRGGAAR